MQKLHVLTCLFLCSGVAGTDMGGDPNRNTADPNAHVPLGKRSTKYQATVTSSGKSYEVYNLGFGADIAIDGLQDGQDEGVSVKLTFATVESIEVFADQIIRDHDDASHTRFKVVVTHDAGKTKDLYFPENVVINAVEKGTVEGLTWPLKKISNIKNIKRYDDPKPEEADLLTHHNLKHSSWWESVKRWYS